MSRVLLTGADGQFGTDFTRLFAGRHEIVPFLEAETDLRDAAAVAAAVERTRPDVVVHAAAWTRVDDAETEVDAAFAVNALGTRHVAAATEAAGARLIAISTDYVFDGALDRPYHEFDEPCPRTVYGASKLAGEREALRLCRRATVVRTAWLYGTTGVNFPSTLIGLAQRRGPEAAPLRVVDDQRGNPTTTFALARLVADLIDGPIEGVVHGTCEGEATWHAFTVELFRLLGLGPLPEPCTTAEFPRPAPRPANSRLDKMVLRLHNRPPLSHWKDALREWAEEKGFRL